MNKTKITITSSDPLKIKEGDKLLGGIVIEVESDHLDLVTVSWLAERTCFSKSTIRNRLRSINVSSDGKHVYPRELALEFLNSRKAYDESLSGKKYNAHKLVSVALKDGSLTRLPCEICGADFTLAHHDDYDKPLDVRFLCRKHHALWHKEFGEGKNA